MADSGARWLRRIRGVLGLPLAFALVAPLGTPATEQAPSLVRHAIAEYGAEHHGELGFSRHLEFKLHVGPVSHDVRNEIGVLMRDGEYVKVRYYSQETNGKTDGTAELQRQEDKANADLSSGRGFFKRPVDPRFAEDYRFETATCEGCSSGQEAFAFTSLVHDRWHGRGTVVIDSANARVVKISYTYEEPPEHATSAEAVETFGQALPNLWTCVHVDETYHGRLGMIGGTATLTYSLDHFRRFAQLDSALAALNEHTF